jgi:DNA repair protein RadD
MFDKIVYNIPIQTLIDLGHLVPLSTKATDYVLDVRGLKIIGGDYSKADLSKRLDNMEVTSQILPELRAFKDTHKHWLVFAIDIQHCEHIAAELNKLGIVAVAIHSKLDIDRKHLLDLFKDGYIQALVSVETLTTGFDAPLADLMVLLRPTASPVLHVQMLGRLMRPHPNKKVGLVLDFAGNVARLGPVDEVELKPKRKTKGQGGTLITKTCPDCKEVLAAAKKECSACGYVFPVISKLDIIHHEAPILASQREPIIKDVPIAKVTYSMHNKPGKPPSFKVTYSTGNLLRYYAEWVAFQHEGYPRIKAEHWWRKHAGNTDTPSTVREALDRQQELKKPTRLKVDTSQKYPIILGYFYD